MTARRVPGAVPAPPDIHVAIATTDADIVHAKRLCYDTYVAVGYTTPSAPAELAPRRPADGLYVVAKEACGTVVGTLRLSVQHPCDALEPWQGRLYPEQALLLAAARRGPSFEIGKLAVRKDVAALHVSDALYRFAYRWALAHGRDYGVICMDARAFRALRLSGWYAVTVGTPQHYLGSLTVPAIIPIQAQPLSTIGRMPVGPALVSPQPRRLL